MASTAAVDQAGADRFIGIDIPDPVLDPRTLTLRPREFPLKQLASSPDGAKRIPVNDEER